MFAASVSFAHAAPKEDAQQLAVKWTTAFADGDTNESVKLYAPDALMIGTQGRLF